MTRVIFDVRFTVDLAFQIAQEDFGEDSTEKLQTFGYALLAFLAGVFQPTMVCMNAQLTKLYAIHEG